MRCPGLAMGSALNILVGTSFAIAASWALGTLLFRKLAIAFHRGEQLLLSFIAGLACLSALVLALRAVNMPRKGANLALELPATVRALLNGAPRQHSAPLPVLRPLSKSGLVRQLIGHSG